MFTKGKTPEAPQQAVVPKALLPEPAKVRAATVSRAVPSIISADVKVKGDVISQGEVQIDGIIEGNIRAAALTIGESGAVKGEVIAESVVVRGTVEGRIRGRKVQLCSGAKVHGDIFHASLAIEPNAVFEGAVKHAQDPTAETPSAPASPAPTQPVF